MTVLYFIFIFFDLSQHDQTFKKQAFPNPTPVNKKLKIFKHYLILK